jgi:hypothetical protein
MYPSPPRTTNCDITLCSQQNISSLLQSRGRRRRVIYSPSRILFYYFVVLFSFFHQSALVFGAYAVPLMVSVPRCDPSQVRIRFPYLLPLMIPISVY